MGIIEIISAIVLIVACVFIVLGSTYAGYKAGYVADDYRR